ncbi:hypothetical protein [Luteimonas huabeiensis]|uniref:hypothetical protein n=1 Tax=Luteimonas huabeiensis TaxID=1244513 RepID=UPI0004647721|nr:hypothetical protein [Luteimonas huabeiensis]
MRDARGPIALLPTALALLGGLYLSSYPALMFLSRSRKRGLDFRRPAVEPGIASPQCAARFERPSVQAAANIANGPATLAAQSEPPRHGGARAMPEQRPMSRSPCE